ncbi:MAG TPA: hypothetical protein VFE63_06195 [Roseiarcus sp.]|jgi:hypothetical protein|nr:hypothetical protein [Roseiarcus sp.]
MRHTLTALLSGASICAFAGVIPAAAQTPTIPSTVGAPAYSYHYTGPMRAPGGRCQIIAGNRVCNAAPTYAYRAAPAYAYGAAPAYPYGYGYPYGYVPPGGPIGAAAAAPLAAAGAVAAAPVAAAGALLGAPVAPVPPPAGVTTATVVPAGKVAPVPGAVGGCDKIAGNMVCTGGYIP